MSVARWTLLGVALFKSIVGLGAFLLAWSSGQGPGIGPGLVANAASTGLYLAVSLALLALARGDQRALLLSTVCALIAAVCGPLIDFAMAVSGSGQQLLGLARAVQLEAFLGLATLDFAARFPHARPSERLERASSLLLRIAAAFAVLLTVAVTFDSLSTDYEVAVSVSGIIWGLNALWGLVAAILMFLRARLADV